MGRFARCSDWALGPGLQPLSTEGSHDSHLRIIAERAQTSVSRNGLSCCEEPKAEGICAFEDVGKFGR